MPRTPDKKIASSASQLFPEDTSPVSESSDEGDSTLSFAKKITTKKFTFKKFGQKKEEEKEEKVCVCPKINWPESVVISSDEELEMSMIEVEKKVSLEMSESD